MIIVMTSRMTGTMTTTKTNKKDVGGRGEWKLVRLLDGFGNWFDMICLEDKEDAAQFATTKII